MHDDDVLMMLQEYITIPILNQNTRTVNQPYLELKKKEKTISLNVFGKSREEAVAIKLRQLHVRDVLDRRRPSELSAPALAYLMFLKEENTGEVKGRGCTDGSSQRD